MKTCLIKLKIGDPIIHPEQTRFGRNRLMRIKSIRLTANGMDDPSIVAVIVGKDEHGTVSGTSNRWIIVDDHAYDKHYPSDDL